MKREGAYTVGNLFPQMYGRDAPLSTATTSLMRGGVYEIRLFFFTPLSHFSSCVQQTREDGEKEKKRQEKPLRLR